MANENSIELTIEGLTKVYRRKSIKFWKRDEQATEVCALNHVSCTLTPGLYGLLGPNGAGKSTLINIITGGLTPTEGIVKWCGRDIRALGIQYRRILGYMPQQQGLYEKYTGRDFLRYMTALKEIRGEESTQAVLNSAEQVNLTDQLDKPLGAYSGGMKQRLLVASALLGHPKLLIMDEPTAGLDPKERVRLRQLIANLSNDCVVLVATHVVSDVESVAKEIILLKDGIIVDQDSPQKLVERYVPGGTLEKVYLHIFGEDDGK